MTASSENLRLRDILGTLVAELVERLDADACAVSRVIGDVLILRGRVFSESEIRFAGELIRAI